MATAPTNGKPIHRISCGPVSVAIWQRTSKDGVFYVANVQRWYSKDGKDCYTDSFGRDDLLTAAKLLDLAHTWIIKIVTAQEAR